MGAVFCERVQGACLGNMVSVEIVNADGPKRSVVRDTPLQRLALQSDATACNQNLVIETGKSTWLSSRSISGSPEMAATVTRSSKLWPHHAYPGASRNTGVALPGPAGYRLRPSHFGARCSGDRDGVLQPLEVGGLSIADNRHA